LAKPQSVRQARSFSAVDFLNSTVSDSPAAARPKTSVFRNDLKRDAASDE